MSESFDRAEESRERNEGFAYVEYHERRSARDEDEDAYDLADPKHPRHHEVYADVSDAREETG